MVRHQLISHGGADPPKFVMRVVSHHRSALERQISEAVRIRRRGGAGAVLNSKSEFNRCHIPRLRVEDEEETKRREEQLRKEQVEKEQQLTKEQGAWELARTKLRDQERRNQMRSNHLEGRRGAASKRLQDKGAQTPGRSKRARKYGLIGEDWGLGSKDIREQEEESNIAAPPQRQEGAHQTPCPTQHPAPHNAPLPPIEGADVSMEQQQPVSQGAVTLVDVRGSSQVSESNLPPNQGLPQPTIPCQFNKQGVCKEHRVLGIRTKTKRRAWVQKKYGFGWSTITSVNYTCPVYDGSEYSDTINRDREVPCISRVNNGGSSESCDSEHSRNLVGPQISAAEDLEDRMGPND